MSSPTRIKNLYTYLIANRRHQHHGWEVDYTDFTNAVQTIRKALLAGSTLRDANGYAHTELAESADPWQAFAKHLIYDRSNGIASGGQSVLRWDHFLLFIAEENFVRSIEVLIKEPNRTSFDVFSAAWEKCRERCGGRRTPLLINRTLAACTLDVSSTANGADFERVYWWLVNEKLLEPLTSQTADWCEKNFHLMRYLRREFAEELALPENAPNYADPILLSIFVWNLSQNVANPFQLKKQVVLYGAPGTGKTYTARQNSALLFSIWQEKYARFAPGLDFEECVQIVQFHPSYGYEDFIEGLRPLPTSGGEWQLRLQNGIFKDFCRKAGTWEIEVSQIPVHGDSFVKRWTEVTIGELRPFVGSHLKHPTWQTFANLPDQEKIADVLPPFFFIIDEINRAELSRVLGELMFSLEYRGVEGAISTQYSALNTTDTAMLPSTAGAKFFIPHNVHIIGTMNTIDRSVESFDFALRRRFRWERIDPDVQILRYHLVQRDSKPENGTRPWIRLADNLESLNQTIRSIDLLGEDYEIGHAYLMNLRYPETLNCAEVRSQLWEDSIKPLLEEYLRGSGRWEGLRPQFEKAFGVS